MTRNRLLVLIVVVLAVVGGAWFVSGRGGSTPSGAEPSPTVPPVAESTTVTSDARAVPIRHVELSAPGGGGVVAEVMVAEGDTVTAGQPLLRLDDAQAKASVDQAKASVAAAGGALKQAQVTEARAGFDEAAARAAIREAAAGVDGADATRDGTPSSGTVRRAANAEVDRARAALRVARAQALAAGSAHDAAAMARVSAEAELDRANAVLAGAQAALDDLTLTAPIAGIVASIDAVAGETVSAAAPVVRIADPAGWRFETIDLDEAAIGRLDVGASATISVDAFEDVKIPAKVASIASFGESSAGDIVYSVVLEPTGPVPAGLRWNMTASAQIDAAR